MLFCFSFLSFLLLLLLLLNGIIPLSLIFQDLPIFAVSGALCHLKKPISMVTYHICPWLLFHKLDWVNFGINGQEFQNTDQYVDELESEPNAGPPRSVVRGSMSSPARTAPFTLLSSLLAPACQRGAFCPACSSCPAQWASLARPHFDYSTQDWRSLTLLLLPGAENIFTLCFFF